MAQIAEALTDQEVEQVEDLTYAWGVEFPEARFRPDGHGGACMIVTPQEAVELAKRAFALGALAGQR